MSQQNSSDGQEKSLEPSLGKLAKARREGDVPQSKEVTATLSYLGLFMVLTIFGSQGALLFLENWTPFFESPERLLPIIYGNKANFSFEHIIFQFVTTGAPLLVLAPFIGASLSLISQRAVVYSPKKVIPKFSRISPIENAKKKYGPSGLFEFSKSLLKLIIICTIFFIILSGKIDSFISLIVKSPVFIASALLKYVVLFLSVILLYSFAVAAIDMPWVNYQHKKKLRMTREELKKENKENEGNPEVKQKRSEKAKSIAENRMLVEVPKSHVVLVNPTHFAVALRWDRHEEQAPVCVAKGTDEIAARIRERAAESNVPIRRDPSTARAIYATVDVGAEVKPEHYKAVAAAIVFAEKIRKLSRENDYQE